MAIDYPSDWDSRRKKVYRRDGYACQNCGARGGPNGDIELHAHHIVQKSQGGTHNLSNLQTLCRACHNAIHYDSHKAPTYGRMAGIDPAQRLLSKDHPVRKYLGRFHAIGAVPLVLLTIFIYLGGPPVWSMSDPLVTVMAVSWVYLVAIGIPTQLLGKKYLIALLKLVTMVAVVVAILYKMNNKR